LEGTLPAGFDPWRLQDATGRAVAHVVAESGHLPGDFDLWNLVHDEEAALARKTGQHELRFLPQGKCDTVAHVAARAGHQPEASTSGSCGTASVALLLLDRNRVTR
jgi:hypothetical protein